MTGEITLRGKVLPVGGIKEKVLAAQRYGLETVILPRRNEADLDDVPPTVREHIKFILVDTVDEVIAAALTPAQGTEEPLAPAAKSAKTKRAPRKQESIEIPVVM
jgi:ATP-dependent Lon protease